MESEQATPVDSIKDIVQSSMKFPKFNKPEEDQNMEIAMIKLHSTNTIIYTLTSDSNKPIDSSRLVLITYLVCLEIYQRFMSYLVQNLINL